MGRIRRLAKQLLADSQSRRPALPIKMPTNLLEERVRRQFDHIDADKPPFMEAPIETRKQRDKQHAMVQPGHIF